MKDKELHLWEELEDLVYQNCNKNTLNFEEYETKYGVDLLRTYLNVSGIQKCIELLNKTDYTLKTNPKS